MSIERPRTTNKEFALILAKELMEKRGTINPKSLASDVIGYAREFEDYLLGKDKSNDENEEANTGSD